MLDLLLSPAVSLPSSLLLVPFLLYSRISRAKLLENAARARLYERIVAEPGIHLRALDQDVKLGLGATRHHLGHLVRHGLVQATRSGTHLRFYPAGPIDDEAETQKRRRPDPVCLVRELDEREPGLSVREAAARLGVSASTVHRARKRLRAIADALSTGAPGDHAPCHAADEPCFGSGEETGSEAR